MNGFELKLDISQRAKEALDREILKIVQTAVEQCQERDEQLLMLKAQNEGDSAPTKGPWKGSCQLEDSITREMHTTLLAALRQSRRYPFYLIEPVMPEDETAAMQLEKWLNPMLKAAGYDKALDDVAYTCLESRWAPMVVGYQEKPYTLTTEEIDPNLNVLTRTTQDVNEGNIYFRTPHPWDVYTWPTNAASFSPIEPNGAEAIIERLYMSKLDLLYAADTLDYDKDETMRLIRMGTPATELHRLEDVMDRLGIAHVEDVIPVYVYTGRPPVILDENDKPLLPKRLWYTDIVYVCVPHLNAVLKRGISPYPIRPYVAFVAYRQPNSLLGHGIVSMLSTIQDEMTATLRLAIDNMNLMASAPFLAPAHWVWQHGDIEFAPGKTIPVPPNAAIQQLQVSPAGAELALQFQQYLYGRAAQIAAAQSVNSMLGGPVRKAAEVEFTANILQTKFDLVVANFQYGMRDAAYAILGVIGTFTTEAAQIQGQPNPLVGYATAGLVERLRFIPQVSSDNLNAQTRLERDTITINAIRQSPLYQAKLQTGDFSGEHKLLRRLLEHMGEPDPESIIGPEPAPAVPQQMPETIGNNTDMGNSTATIPGLQTTTNPG